MKTSHRSATVLGLTMLLLQAAVAQSVAPDFDDWVCEYCPTHESPLGSFWLGIGWLDESTYKFARYTGLDRGGYVTAAGTAVQITESDYWRVDVREPALQSRQISLDGGAAGRFRLRLRYSELPQLIADSTRTIYPAAGSATLQLPVGWISAPNTQGMTALQQSLQPLRLRQDRDRIELGLDLTPVGRWRYALDYEHEVKEGVRAGAGGFLFVSSLLPVPVDQVTDQVTISATYGADRWQAELSYYGSFFDNSDASLVWESPFNPLFPGATSGQLALEPDNEFHRLGLAGSYRLGETTRLSGNIGIGRMTQDDAYLPYTANANLRVAALPGRSLDGEVDVLDFNAQLNTRPAPGTRVAVKLKYYERNNNSPTALYQPVTMDLFVNPPRRNRPYSFDRQTLAVEGSQRLGRAVRLAGGVEYEQIERSREEAGSTDESSAWARLRFAFGRSMDAHLKLVYSDRNGDDLDPAAQIASEENPLLRKFHLADRERQSARLTLSATPHEYVQLALAGGYGADEYSESILGLQDSDFRDVSLDLSVTPTAKFSAHAFYSRERIESRVNGAQDQAGPGWIGETEDRIRSYGAGMSLSNIRDKDIDLSLDYVVSRANGDHRIETDEETDPFPTLVNRLEGVRLRLSIPLRGTAQLVLDYYRENYRSTDWALDGVAPDSIFNLLTLGETSPQYNVDSIALSYRSRF